MILVDTSVWVEHFRKGLSHLKEILNKTDAACHPFVIGELACGNLKNRNEILHLLQSLTSSPVITMQEYLHFIQVKGLTGSGIGFVDIHLLASSTLSDFSLWTFDNKLTSIAGEMNILYKPSKSNSRARM